MCRDLAKPLELGLGMVYLRCQSDLHVLQIRSSVVLATFLGYEVCCPGRSDLLRSADLQQEPFLRVHMELGIMFCYGLDLKYSPQIFVFKVGFWIMGVRYFSMNSPPRSSLMNVPLEWGLGGGGHWCVTCKCRSLCPPLSALPGCPEMSSCPLPDLPPRSQPTMD